jgi:Concanavalin A-like lectin/glucanases superfamily
MLKVFTAVLSLGISLMLTPNAFAGDIVGNWHLDEGQGTTVQDSSGNFNTGTLRAFGSTTGPTWIDRRFDTPALRFGSIGSVEIPDAPVLNPEKITLEAWVRRSRTSNLNEYVISKGAKDCVAASYALYTVGNGALAFYIFDGNNTYVESPAIDASKIWNDRWHHVAGTYDGKMVRLYVDGKEQGNGTPTTLAIGYGLSTNNSLYIGSYGTNCVAKFGGDIDDVRIWNRALTDTEIKLRKVGY